MIALIRLALTVFLIYLSYVETGGIITSLILFLTYIILELIIVQISRFSNYLNMLAKIGGADENNSKNKIKRYIA